MKTVGLRQRQRPAAKPSAAGRSEAPVTVVFRAHTDSLAKAPFLYCPKNYSLPMPSAQEQFTEAIIELCIPCSSNSNNNGSNTAATGTSNININTTISSSGNSGGGMGGNSNKNFSSGNQFRQQHHGVSSGRNMLPSSTLTSSNPEIVSRRVATSLHSDPGNSPSSLHTIKTTGSTAAATATATIRMGIYGNDVFSSDPQRMVTNHAFTANSTPDTWVCRAYCFGEKDALHANGAISVHQSLANKSQFINDITKGKAMARVVPTYTEVCERFGLSHVELAFEDQSISRADMFLISEGLRDQILYEGQEVTLCGFTMKINEMLQSVKQKGAIEGVRGKTHKGDNFKSIINSSGGNNNNNTEISEKDGVFKMMDTTWSSTKRTNPVCTPIENQEHHHIHNQDEEDGEMRYRRMQCGLVTNKTLVNFCSLSAIHYIILEISKEMWDPTLDGRITLSWAIKRFLKEYLMQQIPKHKASPLINILIVGRLHPEYAINGNVDFLHEIKIPRDFCSAHISEEVLLQCEGLIQRILCEVREKLKSDQISKSESDIDEGKYNNFHQDIHPNTTMTRTTRTKTDTAHHSIISPGALTERDIFVYAKNSCTMEIISLVLGQCTQQHVNRQTGYIITVVSGGKGLYQVRNDLHQATCTRLFNAGIKSVNIVCVGRPPLHLTPLLEYTAGDATLRPQYHLHVDQRPRRLYERPAWAACLFYHPVPDPTATGRLLFGLLPQAAWGRAAAAEGPPPPRTRPPLLLPVLLPADKPHNNHTDEYSNGMTGKVDSSLGEGLRRGRYMHQGSSSSSPSFVKASWYCLHGSEVLQQDGFNCDRVLEYVMKQNQVSSLESRTGNIIIPSGVGGVIPCGMNILDSDVQNGYVILKLEINKIVLPKAKWSFELLTNNDTWSLLMSAFSGKDDRLSLDEQAYFVSHFRSSEIFFQNYSAISNDGQTLVLASRRSDITFLTPEEVVFTFRPGLFIECDNIIPFKTTIAHVQIRNSIFFAIKPINPYLSITNSGIGSSTSHNVNTDVLLRRRWQFAHPELTSSSTDYSPWVSLCHCKILPLYGTKSAYPRDSFFVVPTHQYAVSIQKNMQLLEYVLQRLLQQYQIVVVGSSINGVQWPREDPTRNARLEMSIGHQIHELKIAETGHGISVTRMMHRGMYSNAPVTHMITYSYLLFNYMKLGFSVRKMHLETQIGEKLAFPWESLDSYIREREIHEAFIPSSPTWSLREGEICVALLPESFDSTSTSFEEFLKFIRYRFSAHLAIHSNIKWREDSSELTTNIPDIIDYPDSLSLHRVILMYDNSQSLERQCVMDHKTGRTVSFDAAVNNRMMSIEIALPEVFNPKCHYFLKVSWLVCITPIIRDWFGSVLASASKYHLRAVPIPHYYKTTNGEYFVCRFTVEASNSEEEPHFRRRLLSLLTSSKYRYIPDMPSMNRNCRLLHFSGVCYVTSQPESGVVARWYENPLLPTGQSEHQQLLREFTEAVDFVRNELALS
ncbi:Vacuolar membrane-associated protein Iml1 [Trypanosoma melophagium]|uniref:Vacuolar membrane-associated protein Iml1 n=1 Tax=Trypanosoma melophagium TaxID=715481 RepID=UPI00351A39E4|nr:Vacuolar membrane-associated protein Iml1 [Trypanosoma melophagium]